MYAYDIAVQLKKMGISDFLDISYIFDYNRWKNHYNTDYIEKNKDKIKTVLELFSDEVSKNVFEGLIQYRKTSNPLHIITANYDDYFHPIVHPEINDVIIDGGAWHGDSAIDFIEKLDNKCSIFSFEPDQKSYEQLCATIQKNNIEKQVKPINKGLYSKNGIVYFNNDKENDMQYTVQEEYSEIHIDVVTIDSFLDNKQKVNFIKMDIEGSEIDAIKGAQQTIQTYKPKLAICLYHLKNDLWEIPLLIKKINPSYKLYMGHHSQNLLDTVLYAI